MKICQKQIFNYCPDIRPTSLQDDSLKRGRIKRFDDEHLQCKFYNQGSKW